MAQARPQQSCCRFLSASKNAGLLPHSAHIGTSLAGAVSGSGRAASLPSVGAAVGCGSGAAWCVGGAPVPSSSVLAAGSAAGSLPDASAAPSVGAPPGASASDCARAGSRSSCAQRSVAGPRPITLERCGPEVSSLGPASAMATLCVAGSVSGSPCGAPCAPAVSSVAHVLATGTGMPGRRSSAHGIVLAAGADMPDWRLHVLDMVGVLHRDSKETFITTTVTSRFYTVRFTL